MSALPPKADMDQPGCDVRFVPKADIGVAAGKHHLSAAKTPDYLPVGWCVRVAAGYRASTTRLRIQGLLSFCAEITVAGKSNGGTWVRPLGDIKNRDALNEAHALFDFFFVPFFFFAMMLLLRF